jgi:hypothetical protein
MNTRIIGVGLILALAACSGAGSSLPAAGGTSQAASSATATELVIKIPAAAAAASAKRPAYVSASTQSISGSVNPGSGCSACTATVNLAANLTPGSSGCVTTSGATTCTIALSLKPGNYIASVSTYDGPLASGAPTGNELSSNQSVPFTVTVNTANTVPLTLNGIPASLTFALAGSPPATLSGGAVTIDGASTAVNISAVIKDADNNTIVGPGTPTVTAGVTGNTSYKTSVSGTTVTLTTPTTGSRTPATVTVSLTASNCPGASACSASLSANMTEFIAVVDRGAGNAQVYSERTQTLTPITVAAPYGPAFDTKGDLFVASNTGNSVSEYGPPYTGSATATVTNGITGPNAIAVDSNGILYVSNIGLNAVVTGYAPPYTSPPSFSFSGPPATFSPTNLFVDSSNDLWVISPVSGQAVYEFAAPVSATNSTSLLISDCYSATQDGAGDVDISCNDGYMFAYSKSGTQAGNSDINEYFRYLAAYPGGNMLDVLCSDGSPVVLAFLDNTTNNFVHLTASGGDPNGIVVDANKTLYETDAGNGTIAALAYPYTGTPTLVSSSFTSPSALAIWP